MHDAMVMKFASTAKAHPSWLSTVHEILLPDLSIEIVPERLRGDLLAAVGAVQRGEFAAGLPVLAASGLLCGDPRVDAFITGLRALCEFRLGDLDRAFASMAGAADRLPADGRLRYSVGMIALKRGDHAVACDSFERAVAVSPDLGAAWNALALLHCLEQEHQATEHAARQVLRLGHPAPGRLVDLALMQATYCQGKRPEGAFSFNSLDAACDVEELLSRFPPVDPATLRHPDTGDPIYFVYADHAYVIQHAIPLLLSIAETGARCSIHLHVANPAHALADVIKRLRASLGGISLTVSSECVFVEQYASPPVYHSCMRLVRLHQLVEVNRSPVVMLDADLLARHDPQALLAAIEDGVDMVLTQSDADPLWSRFLAYYLAALPTPAASAYLRRVAAFILDNFVRKTARWFLDQLALAVCHDAAGSQVRFGYVSIDCFDGVSFSEEKVFWSAVNDEKHGDNAYTRTKASLCRRHGFMTSLAAPAYAPQLLHVGGSPFLVDSMNAAAVEEVKATGGWRQAEGELLVSLSRPGHTILDLGARFGAATIPLALAVCPYGSVYAVEPDRLEFQTLAANVALAGVSNAFLSSGGLELVEKMPLLACQLIRIGGGVDLCEALEASGRIIAAHRPIVYASGATDVGMPAFELLRGLGYRLLVHAAGGVLCLPTNSWLTVEGVSQP